MSKRCKVRGRLSDKACGDIATETVRGRRRDNGAMLFEHRSCASCATWLIAASKHPNSGMEVTRDREVQS